MNFGGKLIFVENDEERGYLLHESYSFECVAGLVERRELEFRQIRSGTYSAILLDGNCFPALICGRSIGWICAESSVTTGRHKNEFYASLTESINVGPRTIFDGRKSKHAVCRPLLKRSVFGLLTAFRSTSIEIYQLQSFDKRVGNVIRTRGIFGKMIRLRFIHTQRSRQYILSYPWCLDRSPFRTVDCVKWKK